MNRHSNENGGPGYEAIEAILDSLQLDGVELEQLMMGTAERAVHQMNLDRAIQVYRAVVAMDSDSEVAMDRGTDVEAHLALARLFHLRGSQGDAVRYAEQAALSAQNRRDRNRALLALERYKSAGADANDDGPRILRRRPLRDIRASADSDEPLTLAQVAGLDDAKRALFRNGVAPRRFKDEAIHYGVGQSSGVFLWGPEGCGKSTLARATAREMMVPFVSVDLGEALNPFARLGQRPGSAILEMIKRHSDCVLLLEGIDTFFRNREGPQLHLSARSPLDVLLSELDIMMIENRGAFVVGSARSIDDVPMALRSHRIFECCLHVDVPNLLARESIWASLLAGQPAAREVLDVDVPLLAELTEGATPVALERIVQTASRAAWLQFLADDVRRPVTEVDLLMAIRAQSTDEQLRARIEALVEVSISDVDWDAALMSEIDSDGSEGAGGRSR